MNLFHYEFQTEEVGCQCQRCVELNIVEGRNFMLSYEEEGLRAEESRLMQRHREIVSLRRELKVEAQKIQQVRIQIEEFGKKKLSDLTFIKG